jgi:hypothetical protein
MATEVQKRMAYLKKNHLTMWIALSHHRTHKNEKITFAYHQYLRDIFLDKAGYIVAKKATQGGYTEYLVGRALGEAIGGRGIFYVMPTFSLVSRFVKNRIDRTIENTPYYKNQIRDQQGKFSTSISLKHVGKGSIAFIGSNSSSGFTEFPADSLIIDELDECDQSSLSMAEERLSASKEPRIVKIGNPTIQEFGIDSEFLKSDRKEWNIQCQCGKWIKPDFFTHVVTEIENKEYVIIDEDWEPGSNKDIRMICHKCHKPLDRFGEGRWEAEAESPISGYHVSKLFSTNMKMARIVERFQEGLKDDSKMQRFYNGDLGIAYTAKGSKLDYELLNACKENYNMPSGSTLPCIMGADVGSVIHVKIGELLQDKRIRVVYIGTVNTEEDVMNLYRQYNCKVGCIDAMPEKRLSKRLASILRGMFVVYYGEVKVEKVNIDDKMVVVDRTATLDGVREAILTQQIILPKNADKLLPLRPDGASEYYYEMTTSVRVFDEDKQKYFWREGTAPDHYMHATNYMLIAKRMLMKVM